MKQSSMQILLIPLLVIALVVGAITDSQMIFIICVAPIIVYILWFRFVVYRCPKCGYLFNQYQVYTYECKYCHTKFDKK